MHFRLLLSDQHSDLELSEEDLQQPFLLGPSVAHPFLTLADYFGALQQFIIRNADIIVPKKFDPEDGLEIVIRSEKHGAFYHIASVSLAGRRDDKKFAVTTALSVDTRLSLLEELNILKKLSGTAAEFIPEIYCHDTLRWESDQGLEEFIMVMGEWFAGYHEWHAGEVPGTGEYRIQLWDYDDGYRFLNDAETYELLRQAAHILTCCYDQATHQQVYPWHHGAGDFIARCDAGSVSVKLITARQYEPLVHFDRMEEADNLVAAIHYLLNLTLRMRLDRLNGVGAPVWLDTFAIRAAIAGFFTGLEASRNYNRLLVGPAEDFLAIIQSFDSGEILDMYSSLLEIYADEDPDDFNLIREKVAAHSEELYRELQNFSL